MLHGSPERVHASHCVQGQNTTCRALWDGAEHLGVAENCVW